MEQSYIFPSVSSILNRKSPIEINNLKDLIKLCDASDEAKLLYPDIAPLSKIKAPLIKLYNLIGLHDIKKEIMYQILKYCQNVIPRDSLRHCIITGPPGVGKTTLCGILAEIYSGLGQLDKGHVVKVKRKDLIGKYLGHTAVQTSDLIKSAFGGVLLIDEAYSLGNPGGSDSFSRECIDTLNQHLSDDCDKFICIIVGYKASLDSSFFSYNPGLRSRFPVKFNINNGYSSDELLQMFARMSKEEKWYIDLGLVDSKKFDKKYFPFFGRNVKELFDECCTVSLVRTFGLAYFFKKRITYVDFNKGMFNYLKNNKKEDDIPDYLKHIYV